MKLIHLADIHLGKSLNEFSLIEDQRYILKQILGLVSEKEADGVLIAGDVYDRSVPSEEAVRLFDDFLTALAERGKAVFVISGNHDSDERLNFGSQLFTAKNIYIAGTYNGKIRKVDLEDEYGKVHFWLVPFIKASSVSHFYPEEDCSTYEAAFRTVLKHCAVNTEERNVLLLHQFISGSGDPELSGSETSLLSVGNVEKIGSSLFRDFDYVAMGHIHRGQQVGRESCRYAGSPLKYSLSPRELDQEKTIPLLTLGEKGQMEISLLPLHPLREVRHIRGRLQELIDHAVDTEDYIYATLTDEEVQYEAMARLQEVYPRAVKLDYDNQRMRKLQEPAESSASEEKSFTELMVGFSRLIQGREPEEEEWRILREVAEEAGVL